MEDQRIVNNEDYAVVLIDGVCHLCQGLTQFIIRRDPAGAFRFASLQSEIGQELLRQGGFDGESTETMILIENGKYYTRSTGALRIARRLRFPWSLSYALILIPPVLRNLVYRWVAKNRYRWFGRSNECMVPTPEIRRRFLS
ncbi:putative thiol-disulfide oxidoreductase DCC [Paenibacillus vortex V453]|jgi:predicted DCC family thiol-disulfide oxidoreductase YuxK|uniref:Thiol-disulfide oxidoreductase DCC n=2 Tax=Paenibacillus TaxID=44249 RepID=A0A163FWU2_9BACL|nr:MULTISPECIES: thiol-disulfide oxidoreductase DCC family protein [Paenibacillus]ANA79196.1 thiol-disulfide oxidoreductase DCC [Paenibacillus glucanolyticus]AVV56875.1 thiol-disulfide oxidoreductase DCC family protein [Paenibacillus glucanolyticus]AWP26033.1 thiol-disulfide oxidoreductase DCC [Paenibacillus sp. Cedars]EFU38817.1 putative thiol-disulfide oxidoreductase DCC [Paenibacillus vortex V453]ETT34008.1 putative thiol-disulfide oxidoreductase DCC [Paenibacillus sp. FSL R5-808]